MRAKVLIILRQTLTNELKPDHQSMCMSVRDMLASPEQMEVAKLRAEFARVEKESDILKSHSFWALLPI
jgi:transposase-like protein